MITSTTQRIQQLTRSGSWGNDTLHGMLAQHARSRPQHLAIKDQPNREQLTGTPPLALTWAELDWASESLACQLQSQGIGEDDRLIAQLPNITELVVVYYAASKIGAILSPIPVQYGSHELRLMADTLGATGVITLNRFRENDLAATARRALPQIKAMLRRERILSILRPGLGKKMACLHHGTGEAEIYLE